MKSTFFKHRVLLMTSMLCITLSFGQKNSQLKQTSSIRSYDDRYINIQESVGNQGESIINYKNGQERYTIRMLNDKVSELYINDKKIPADSIYLYKEEIDKINEQIKKDRARAEEDRKQAGLDRKQAEKDRAQAQEDRKQAEKDREQAEKDRAQAEKERVRYKADQGQYELNKKQAEKDREQAEKDRQQAEKDRQQALKDRAQAELDRKQAEEDRAIVKSLIAELVKQNIVSDEKSVTSVRLNNDEFYVNGKKQSEELHTKFKAAFLKKRGYSISFKHNPGYNIQINGEESSQ